MRKKPARSVSNRTYLRIASIAMILGGLFIGILTAVVVMPNDAKAVSALTRQGIQTRGTVTRCPQSEESDQTRPAVACWVRFTPAGRDSVESQLAFVSGTIVVGQALTVVYDPQNTATVAVPSDLGFWPTLTRNGLNLVFLVVSVGMVLVGIVALVLQWLLTPLLKRYAQSAAELRTAA